MKKELSLIDETREKNRKRALKAWDTIRANQKKEANRQRALKAWKTIRKNKKKEAACSCCG